LVASARRNPKVIVIASDGRPNTKNAKYYGYTEAMKTYVRQQADYAATKRVRILSVAVGTLADKTLMRYLATKTGGKYYEVVDEIMLEDIFTEVAHVSTIRLVPTE
jgi:Mg-chelatase subunit ChlD